MNFLQPWMLFALPLVALPVVIHLIHRNRHRSLPWAAMMFLIKANRMNKGMARIRYLLIMAMRVLALAALILALGRPLVSSKLGGFGMGRPDLTMILLDRSASMESQDLQSGQSKRSTAIAKLTELLEQRGYGNELILIDSATNELHPIEAPSDLFELPWTQPTATTSNLPLMMETAIAYLKANEVGRADVWICSDLQSGDWDPESGRWAGLKEDLTDLKGVQSYLLSYSAVAKANYSVRIENLKRERINDQSELVMDIFVNVTNKSQANHSAESATDPAPSVEVVFEQVRSTVELTWGGEVASLIGHRIPIEDSQQSGWGYVSLPGDSNEMDNRYYFVFSEPPVRRAVIVSADPKNSAAFKMCLSIPMESGIQHAVEILDPSRVAEIDWDNLALLVWQAPLPDSDLALRIEQWISADGVALFFPSDVDAKGSFMGASWGEWLQVDDESLRSLTWWRSDADLLANVGNGDPLPLDELKIFQYAPLRIEDATWVGTPLAKLDGEVPLMLRHGTASGAAYFCQTLPIAPYTSMEQDAVAFYVMMQRALEQGSQSLSLASQKDARFGLTEELKDFKSVDLGDQTPNPSERGTLPGVYSKDQQWVAINRNISEDADKLASVDDIDPLFEGLPYQRIEDEVGDTESLASEVWRAFLFFMAFVLIVEGWLCLPEKTSGPKLKTAFSSTKS